MYTVDGIMSPSNYLHRANQQQLNGIHTFSHNLSYEQNYHVGLHKSQEEFEKMLSLR